MAVETHSREYCLARADECERMAETSMPPNKTIFLDLARQWRKLAHDSSSASFEPVGEARPARRIG